MSFLLDGLEECVRKRVSNWVDDFLGSAVTEEELIHGWRSFLLLCRKHGVTLRAEKTRVGFPSSKFLGRLIDGSGEQIHPDRMEPVREMVAPLDKSSLRHTLGVFVQSKDSIPRYKQRTAPLTRLTGKVPWVWGEGEQRAFEDVKEAVLKNTKLFSPDYSKPFYWAGDASDKRGGGHGGGIVFQLTTPLSDTDLANASVEDFEKFARIIRYVNVVLPDSVKKKPIYYREAYVLLAGLEKNMDILVHSPFEVAAISDHAPLQWIHKVAQGKVSEWVLEKVAEVPFRVIYAKGTYVCCNALA